MKTTIDAAGRLVVPKALRDALGLRARSLVEVSELDGRIVLEPVPLAMRLIDHGQGPVIEPEGSLPPLTAEQVRVVLEGVRR